MYIGIYQHVWWLETKQSIMDGSMECNNIQPMYYDQTQVSIDVHSQLKKNQANVDGVTSAVNNSATSTSTSNMDVSSTSSERSTSNDSLPR